MTLLPDAPATLDIVWRLTLCGLGFGLFQSPNNKVIVTSAPRERAGRGERDAVDGAAHRPVARRRARGGDLRPDPRARRRSGP